MSERERETDRDRHTNGRYKDIYNKYKDMYIQRDTREINKEYKGNRRENTN